MNFRYTQEWADELLHLYSLEYTDGDEEERIYELIEMTEGSNDVRVAKVLIECLCISINGIDERIKSMFTTMSFEVYYEALFSSVRVYIKKWKQEIIFFLAPRLSDWYARELTQEELETVVFPLAKKYLTKKDIEFVINDIEELNELGDSPIDEFYAFFNKELDANWTPPRQDEVEPMSEEETQKYKDEAQKMLDEITKSLED
jgi:hypothetical protein